MRAVAAAAAGGGGGGEPGPGADHRPLIGAAAEERWGGSGGFLATGARCCIYSLLLTSHCNKQHKKHCENCFPHEIELEPYWDHHFDVEFGEELLQNT